MMMHFNGLWGIGGPIIMMIFGALFIGVLIYFAVIYSRNSSSRFSRDTGEETAMEILKKRFAKGEISKDEYESMKNSLL